MRDIRLAATLSRICDANMRTDAQRKRGDRRPTRRDLQLLGMPRHCETRFLTESVKVPLDRQVNYGLPVCCAHEKRSATERTLSAMVLYVLHHFLVAELIGPNPPVVNLSEQLVVYILLNCS